MMKKLSINSGLLRVIALKLREKKKSSIKSSRLSADILWSVRHTGVAAVYS